MRNLIAYLLISSVFLGCNKLDKPKKPDNLIPKDEMVNVIYDVFLLNSAKGVQKKTLELNGIFPENYVYEKYSIDSTQFALSNNYYVYDTEVYKGIMDKVKARITTEKKIVEELKEREEKEATARKDSIKKLRKLADTIPKKIRKRKKIVEQNKRN
jgi:hypothetical protein